MAYCTNLDVLAIVDTDITPAEIDDLIDRTDVRIDMRINSGAANALFLEDLSATWTSLRCMLKDPNARGLGQYNENRGVTMRMLKEEIDDMLELAGGGIAFTAASESLGDD